MARVKLTPAIRVRIQDINGEFSSRNMHNIKAEQTDYPWTAEAVGQLAESPDPTTWLILADRLEEENNPAHIMIRVVFQDGYVPPAGFHGAISRGGWYWENGSSYSEGVNVEWSPNGHEGPGLYTTYWANGNFTRTFPLAEARAALTMHNGPRCSEWRTVGIRGSVPTARRVLPGGSEVSVRVAEPWSGKGEFKTHVTKKDIDLPEVYYPSYSADPKMQTVRFEYQGFETVAWLRDFVIS